jgi:membrane fusion protein (multidrug efflux system)
VLFITFSVLACDVNGQSAPAVAAKLTLITVQAKTADITQQYLCRINSHHHIEVRAPEDGYLQELAVKEGQAVKRGETMFRFLPVLHQARLDSELADLQIAQIELKKTKKLVDDKVASQDALQLLTAKVAKAQAEADLARAELSFADVRAPFDGMIDRIPREQGSLVLKGETLTNLFDNSTIRVYFNVPEKHYLEYMADRRESKKGPDVELILADHSKFPHTGKISTIEATFDVKTGTIAFCAEFPNPNGLLRHGQTGTVIIRRALNNVIAIPQRATLETLNKPHVFIVDKSGIARRREVVIQSELDDEFVIRSGVSAGEKIVVDGIRQVRDGDKVEN